MSVTWSRSRWCVAAAALAAAAGLAGCGPSPPGPDATVAAFVTAWDHGDYPGMAALVDAPPPDFVGTYTAATTALGSTASSHVAGRAVTQGSGTTAPVTSHLTVAGFGPLDVHSTLQLHKVSGKWRIAWSPTAIADQLLPGDHLAVTRSWPARAGVIGAGGAPLTPPGVKVGVVGQRITDPTQLTSLLVAAHFPPSVVSQAITAAEAHPTQLEAVGNLPLATYQQLKAQPGTNLYSISGTTFTQGAQSPLSPDLAAHVLGDVGPITADQLKSLGAPYTATSQVGQTGIEGVYERQLAGTPAVTVAIEDAKGTTTSTLGTKPASPGRAVTTTIDPVVQGAAETAMDAADPTKQAAMVVMRASTGEILASVSRPLTGFDVALDGLVPPGSTFKIVTTTALLQHGATAATPTTCPKSLAVNGQTFTNFEGETSLDLTLATAFSLSCNTAFIQLAAGLPSGQSLVDAAGLYGLGAASGSVSGAGGSGAGSGAGSGSASGGTPKAGLAVAASKVPLPVNPNDRAATAIGQAQVVVSPLAMAGVAATADSGAYHAPRLVVGAADDTAPPAPLPAGVADVLHTLMTAVVTSGTAANEGLPAGTAGKTGTAEYGPGPHPATHAWFIGYRGDLAFAVLVFGGGIGGPVAAPLAAKMLDALPAGYDATPAG